MSEAETILKLIEEVDPADTARLDEIDARVGAYMRNEEYLGIKQQEVRCMYEGNVIDTATLHLFRKDKTRIVERKYLDQYTRSRDALKATRPEGWEFQGDVRFACDIKPSGVLYRFWAMLPKWAKWNPVDNSWIHSIESPKLETEELAELHAIIQAIEYERKGVA